MQERESTSALQALPQKEDPNGAQVTLKLLYNDRHVEYRICSKDRAEWIAYMEGDHLTHWEILHK